MQACSASQHQVLNHTLLIAKSALVIRRKMRSVSAYENSVVLPRM